MSAQAIPEPAPPAELTRFLADLIVRHEQRVAETQEGGAP